MSFCSKIKSEKDCQEIAEKYGYCEWTKKGQCQAKRNQGATELSDIMKKNKIAFPSTLAELQQALLNDKIAAWKKGHKQDEKKIAKTKKGKETSYVDASLLGSGKKPKGMAKLDPKVAESLVDMSSLMAALRMSSMPGLPKGRNTRDAYVDESLLSPSSSSSPYVDESLLSSLETKTSSKSSVSSSQVKVQLKDSLGKKSPTWTIEPNSLKKVGEVWHVPATPDALRLVSDDLHESGGVSGRYELVLDQNGTKAVYHYLMNGKDELLARKTPFY